MKKRNRLIIGMVAVLMLACACPATSLPTINDQPPAQTPTNPPFIVSTLPANPTSAPPSLPTGDVLFSDDFSATSKEMETYTDENGKTETRDGVYVVRAVSDLWHWGKSNSQFNDTVIEVDAKMVVGPSNNNVGFGVICRLSEREDTSIDGYMFAITADGYYTIRSITSSSMSPLVDYTYSSAINQGSTTNRIRASCNGSELKLEVNGTEVASAVAAAGGSSFGSIAFSAISFESAERIAEIHFDNLIVSKP